MCTKLSEKGLQEFMSIIGTKFYNTRQFALNLAQCENAITPKQFRLLALQIDENLRELELLDLNFAMCTKIADNGLLNLASCIGPNHHNLKALKLNFCL